MSSMDTRMEDGDILVSSSRDGTTYGRSDYSGWGGDSLISGPNITSSSTSTDNRLQQQISTTTAAGGCTDDLMIVSSSSSCASSSWFQKNNEQSEIRIFNVDFRAFSQVALHSTSDKDGEEEKGSEINKQNAEVLPRSEFHGDLLKIGSAGNNKTDFRLVDTLMACAYAVEQDNLNVADALVVELRSILAVQQSGVKKNVATYFTDALERRIHEVNTRVIELSLYNKAIHKAFADSSKVHIIDFNLNRGLLWRVLMRELGLRPGGPSAFRLTAIGSLQPDILEWEIAQLKELAKEREVEFEFHRIVANSLEDVVASISDIKLSNLEAVAVNFVLEPYHLMLSRPGASEVEKLLKSIKEMKPKIVTSFKYMVEEPSPFGRAFVERFKEAWHYHSKMFPLLEKKEFTQSNSIYSDLVEEYLRMQIQNMVTGDELGLPCCEWEMALSWG